MRVVYFEMVGQRFLTASEEVDKNFNLSLTD